MIKETREVKGRISIERRFFISSLPANARQIAQAVRVHWAIENTLHWTLDVVFNEDKLNRTQRPCATEHGHRAPCGAQHIEHCEKTVQGHRRQGPTKKSRLGQ